jgi:large subunit ribosomal protein L31
LKENIHPKYFKTTATCACGAQFEVGSTKEGIRVDICSKCHPLFTGTMKLLDTEGRVEKFKKKYEKAAERGKAQKEITEKKKKEKEEKAKKAALAGPLPGTTSRQGAKASVMEKLAEMRKGTEKKAGVTHKKPEKKPAKKSK